MTTVPKLGQWKRERITQQAGYSQKLCGFDGFFGLDDVFAFASLLAGEVDGMLEEAEGALLATRNNGGHDCRQ
jgi:hypothetical protein